MTWGHDFIMRLAAGEVSAKDFNEHTARGVREAREAAERVEQDISEREPAPEQE